MSIKYGASRLAKSLGFIFKQAKAINKDSVKLIGQDNLGNKYFEAHRPNHPRPVQRYYDAPKRVESFDAIVEAVHVPPAWDAWLRFRRKEPPTAEEERDGEDYYRMQQEMAAAKKPEESTVAEPTSFNQDSEKKAREVPKGTYKTMLD